MEVKIESNQLRINIQDLFENLTEEEMDEVASHYMWNSTIYKNLVSWAKQNLAGEGYNEDLFLVEKAFFTMSPEEIENEWEGEYFTDGVFDTMKTAVREILIENAKKKVEIYKHDCARSAVYNWVKATYGDEAAWKMNSIYLEKEFGKPASYELAREMEHQVDFVTLTQDWVAEMIKLFNPKMEQENGRN
jgi:hypothetical protein